MAPPERNHPAPPPPPLTTKYEYFIPPGYRYAYTGTHAYTHAWTCLMHTLVPTCQCRLMRTCTHGPMGMHTQANACPYPCANAHANMLMCMNTCTNACTPTHQCTHACTHMPMPTPACILVHTCGICGVYENTVNLTPFRQIFGLTWLHSTIYNGTSL